MTVKISKTFLRKFTKKKSSFETLRSKRFTPPFDA